MTAIAMELETSGLKSWLTERLRRTNWMAAGIAGLLQLGFVAMVILMGIVTTTPKPKSTPLVTTLSATERTAAPPPAAPTESKPQDKPIVPPRADTVVPPVKIELAASQPIPAAVQKAPDPPTPAAAAPSTPAAASVAAAGDGPIKANLSSNLLSAPKPVFPNSSRRKHESGVVTVRVVVGEDGRVDDISLQRSSGFPDLDQAVIAAVKKWRWSPTLRDGRPTRITGLIPINMVLHDS